MIGLLVPGCPGAESDSMTALSPAGTAATGPLDAPSDGVKTPGTNNPTLTTHGFVGICLAGVLGPFAFTSMTTTTAAISRSLHVAQASAAVVLVAYGAAFAALLLVGGRLGDALGRVRMLRVGLGLMVAASIAITFAPSLGVLIAGRVVQGAASALFFPQLLALVQTGATRTRRLALIARYTAVLSLGTTGGQMLGGALTAANLAGLGWRSLPLLTAVLALAALASSAWISGVPASGERIDRMGAGLLVVGLGTALAGVAMMSSWGLTVVSGCLVVGGLLLLAALVAAEQRRETHGAAVVLSPRALRVPAVGLGAMAIVVFYTAFTGFLVAWSAYGIAREGAAAASLSFVVPGVAFLLVSLFLHRVVARLGSRTPLVGAGVQAVGLIVLLVMLGAGAPGGLWGLVPAATVMTVGNALMYGPLMPVVMGGVPTKDAGMASGIFATAQQVAMALGSAVFAGLWGVFDGPGDATRGLAGAVEVILGACALYAMLAWRLTRRSTGDDAS